jgi:cytochrome c oxidase cbb3-type subunit 1/cytochrome c oxidase cbb3-type subunit I/II
LRGVNLLTHFTQYVPGHAHLSLLFFSASVIIGGIYFILPRVLNVSLYSRAIANVQFSLYVIGFTFFFGGFLLTGLVQGTAWLHQGLPVWPVLPGLRPYMALRTMGGVLLWSSFILFTFNVFATVFVRRPILRPTPPLEDVSPLPGEPAPILD